MRVWAMLLLFMQQAVAGKQPMQCWGCKFAHSMGLIHARHVSCDRKLVQGQAGGSACFSQTPARCEGCCNSGLVFLLAVAVCCQVAPASMTGWVCVVEYVRQKSLGQH